MCRSDRSDRPNYDPRDDGPHRGTRPPMSRRERERLRRHHEGEAEKGGWLFERLTPVLRRVFPRLA